MHGKLTPKERLFCAAYEGNGVAAMRAAGYRGNDRTLEAGARQNLAKPRIRKAVDSRLAKAENKLIATREERQEFWTSALRAEVHEIGARLKASELLGRSESDFVEKSELNIVAKIEVVTPYGK